MAERIQVLIMRPGQLSERAWIENTYENISRIIGGEFEIDAPLSDGTVVVYRKDISPGAEVSRIILNSRREVAQSFTGTIIAAGYFQKEKELDSLTEDELMMCNSRYKMPAQAQK